MTRAPQPDSLDDWLADWVRALARDHARQDFAAQRAQEDGRRQSESASEHET